MRARSSRSSPRTPSAQRARPLTPSVSVIIPTLNESGNLSFVLNSIPPWVDEVIVVDGRSSDDTERVARALWPDVRIIEQTRPGKGAALRSGFRAARGDILITLDADGSMDGAQVDAFRSALVAGADYVKGCRFCPGGGSTDITRIRRGGDRAIGVLLRTLFGVRLRDATYGYVGLWADCVEDIASEYDSFAFEILMAIRTHRAGLTLAEVPCFEAPRIYGASNLSAVRDGLRILGVILGEFVRLRRSTTRAKAKVSPRNRGATMVVAGPGSSTTVPGIMVAEIVRSLGVSAHVVRLEVDPHEDYASGLLRATSLMSTSDSSVDDVVTREMPHDALQRARFLSRWVDDDVAMAIAVAWPGFASQWVGAFVEAARTAGASSVVLCASVPGVEPDEPSLLAKIVADADLVLVGDVGEASALAAALGPSGPVVEVHHALSMRGRHDQPLAYCITAFLPRDNREVLGSLLAAFDAIPDSRIASYLLRVVMRADASTLSRALGECVHAERVELIDTDLSDHEIDRLCKTSSVFVVADPAFGSRAFQRAVDCGISTVVLSSLPLPEVHGDYAGGLLADARRPASIDVALEHALRLRELRFSSPEAWGELAARLARTSSHAAPAAEPVTEPDQGAGT